MPNPERQPLVSTTTSPEDNSLYYNSATKSGEKSNSLLDDDENPGTTLDNENIAPGNNPSLGAAASSSTNSTSMVNGSSSTLPSSTTSTTNAGGGGGGVATAAGGEESSAGQGGGTAAAAAAADTAAILEERLIDAEYKIWKKNTPYLYDFVMTHSLEWPSLTVQWLPTVRNTGLSDKTEEHTMLIGTHTTGEQNYLMVASVNLPKGDTVIDHRLPLPASSAPSPINNTANATSASQIGLTTKSNTQHQPSPLPPSAPPFASVMYDDDRSELGGYGLQGTTSSSTAAPAPTTTTASSPLSARGSVGRIEIRMKLKHRGEVNRARHMPQNHFIVASRGPHPEVYIWDFSKHPSFPTTDSPFSPHATCLGHSKEGYGLAWSTHEEGRLLSGSEDGSICLWDVKSALEGSSMSHLHNYNNNSGDGYTLHAVSTFRGHTDVVEDVDWHRHDPNLIGSVSDDKTVRIWDARERSHSQSVHMIERAHEGDVNSIAFNPLNEFLFATGSADKAVALWDMRNLKTRMQTLIGHTDQVFNVSWAPHNESILASCSADRRVAIWDLSRIGMEQTAEDAEDGPPELLFLHGGHTSKVSDFSWNTNDEWTIVSVSEDNVLQVWNMAEEIYAQEEEIMSSGDGEDAVLGDDELE